MANLPGRDSRPQSQPSRPAGKETKKPLPGPIPLAYGVEIEAIVVIARGDAVPGLQPGLPLPIQVPGRQGTAATFEHIKHAIQRVLERHGLPTETVVAVNVNEPPPSRETLDAYSFLDVKDDWSIDTPGQYLASLEISTPGLADTGDSYEVLRYAVNVLTSSFLMTVNSTCGLHVHVGQADGFTYDALRRIGSFLWAAEPLLLALNPPWRALSSHCPGLRDFSRLARGAETEDLPAHDEAYRCLRGGRRPGERPPAWREVHPEAAVPFPRTRAPGHFAPCRDEAGRGDPYDFSRPRPGEASPPAASSAASSSDAGDAPAPRRCPASQRQIAQRTARLPRRAHVARERLVPLPRLRRARHGHAELRAWAGRLRPPVAVYAAAGAGAPPAAGLYAGVRRLYEAETSGAVAALLTDAAGSRMNVHLGPPCRCGAPRTVEFRGAEGSLDAAWVVCWARVCVGLVRFAVNAPVRAFLDVLKRCREAGAGAPYDVVDLLCHVGLLPEAHMAAQRLRENAGPWELGFLEEPVRDG